VMGKILESRVRAAGQQAANSAKRLQNALLDQLRQRQGSLAVLCGKLDAISPLRVLARGYSLTQRVDTKTGQKQVLNHFESASPGDILITRLASGSIRSRVEEAFPPDQPGTTAGSPPVERF